MAADRSDRDEFTVGDCPRCGFHGLMAVLPRPPRAVWPLGVRLGQQSGTLATAAGAAAVSIISQADTLPHPWNHVVTILGLVVAVVAAIKVKT